MLNFKLVKEVEAAPFNIGDNYAFGQTASLGEGFKHLILPAFSLAATAVVIYFLIGAFKWLASGGDKNAIAAARGMITHAIIGFMLLIFMFFVVQFLPVLLGIDPFKVIK